jgi:hypothetical protein
VTANATAAVTATATLTSTANENATTPAIASAPVSGAGAPSAAPAPVPSAPPPSRLDAAPTAAAAAAPFDASRARVDWSVTGAGGGATAGAVQRALSRRAGAWTECYRRGLERRNERIEGAASLHLTTDETGNVVGAHVNGFDAMPGVKGCVAAAAHVRVEGVDTGDAWADVQLTFKAD